MKQDVLFALILKNYFMRKVNLFMMNILILKYIKDFSEIIIKIWEIILKFLRKIIIYGFYL